MAARTPHPLIEHALDLFARLESDATILLRPQNDQTFETSTRSYSLQEQLAEIVLDATGPARGPNPFVKDLRRLPNIYIISYPKYYDDVFLLYPLLGHEIGHVVAEIRQLFLRANQEARGLLGNLGLDEFELRSAQTLAANWAQEFYCDLVGKALYGEPYIFALHLMLLPYPRAFRMCSFEEYVRTSYQSTKALVDLLKGDPATIAGDHDGGSARKAPEPRATLQYPVAAGRGPKGVGITHQTGEPGWHSDQLFRIYPSPGQRLRLLEEEHRPSRQAPGSSQFRSWRRKLRSEALSFSEKFESPIYSAILNAAKAIAKRLSANTIEGRPAGFLPGPHTAQLQQLVEKLRNRIPPCEWRSQSGALQPGDWQTALHAGWIVFLENTLASDGRRSKDWAFEYLEFVYDSLDMLGLARTYKSAAVGLPARER